MKDREEVPVGSGPEACRHETHETQTWDLSTNLYDLSTNLYDWVFKAKSLTHQKRVNSDYFLSRETSANASILVFCVCQSLTEFVKLQQFKLKIVLYVCYLSMQYVHAKNEEKKHMKKMKPKMHEANEVK